LQPDATSDPTQIRLKKYNVDPTETSYQQMRKRRKKRPSGEWEGSAKGQERFQNYNNLVNIRNKKTSVRNASNELESSAKQELARELNELAEAWLRLTAEVENSNTFRTCSLPKLDRNSRYHWKTMNVELLVSSQ
jgi:hypothetical protein